MAVETVPNPTDDYYSYRGYKVLPVWCTDLKPYYERYADAREKNNHITLIYNKSVRDYDEAFARNMPIIAAARRANRNLELAKEAAREYLQAGEDLQNAANLKGIDEYSRPEQYYYFMKDMLERGFNYSVVSFEKLNEFLVYLPMTSYNLKNAPEEAYNDLCSVLGLTEVTTEIKKNIDATIKLLVNDGKVKIDKDNNIKYANEKLNTLLEKLGNSLGVGKFAAEKKKRTPTNKPLWARAIAEAKKKYDVYPSAYANGFALKWYKEHGGGWRGKKKI